MITRSAFFRSWTWHPCARPRPPARRRTPAGWYRSTPHRVRNASGRDRFSFPFFFDPDFTAEIPPLPGRTAVDDGGQPRWDGQNLHAHRGTYGDYLLGKVSRVFRSSAARY